MGQQASSQDVASSCSNSWNCQQQKCSSCCSTVGNELHEPATSSTADPYEDVIQMRVPFSNESGPAAAVSFLDLASASETDLLRDRLHCHDEENERKAGLAGQKSISVHDNSIEWLNWLFTQMWPNVSKMLKKITLEKIEPAIEREIEKLGIAGRAFKGTKFSHFDLGSAVPELGPIKAYRRSAADYNGIEIDCGMHLECEPLITLEVAGHHIGIHKFTFDGQCSVILKPLLDKEPLVGGFQGFLLKRPDIEFEFTGLPAIVNGSLLYRVTKKVVLEQIARLFVIPNRITISLVKEWELNADIVAIQHPRPEGIIRIRVLEAANLPEADIAVSNLFSVGSSSSNRKSGNSDPYCIVHVGSQTLRTPTVNNNLFPKWPVDGSIADFFVFNVRQPVDFEVYDDDFGLTRDDLLGKVSSDVRTLLQSHRHSLNLGQGEVKNPMRTSGQTISTPKHPDDAQTSQSSDMSSKPTGVMGFMKRLGGKKAAQKDTTEEQPTLSFDVKYFDVVAGSRRLLHQTISADTEQGPNEALLSVFAYGMRPVGARADTLDAKGMRLRLHIRSSQDAKKDSSMCLSKPCTVRGGETQPIAGVSEAVVRIAQNLQALHPQMTIEQIAETLELEVSTVQRILGMKQIMPLMFNEGLHFLVPHVSSDVCIVELMAGENKSMHPVGSIEIPLTKLLDERECLISRLFPFCSPEDGNRPTKENSTGGKDATSQKSVQSRGRLAKMFGGRARSASQDTNEESLSLEEASLLTEAPNGLRTSSSSHSQSDKLAKTKKIPAANEPPLKYEVGLQFQLFCLQPSQRVNNSRSISIEH